MIIQKVIRGIGGITDYSADRMFDEGIPCNWWRTVGILGSSDITKRLTEENLDWHQNRYTDIDPNFSAEFKVNTPFISTTAGSIERDSFIQNNILHQAWFDALAFASDGWQSGGYLFYCHLFVLGKQSISYPQFSEELRELNIYKKYSSYCLEGEIAAKIFIPNVQIQKWEYYDLQAVKSAFQNRQLPSPTRENKNNVYALPENINNVREFL